MSDPHPARAERDDNRTLLQRLIEFIRPGPDSTDELMATLAEAEDKAVIGAESRVMLEGVLKLADMTAGDAMVAAPRMDLLDIEAPLKALMNEVIRTAHSRFPVFEGDRENIIGVLMAKDLLKLLRSPELNLRALLRPVVYVPETKGLNDLLREFRVRRNHLAIVVDEFGRTAGLITIEDVLEQIVGEIEDEFDEDAGDQGEVFALTDKTFRVAGDTSIERVNEAFGVDLAAAVRAQDGDEDLPDFDTIGGLVSHAMGHVPRRGEFITLANLNFFVLHTKSGAVRWFKVSPAVPADTATQIAAGL
ncbi:magnesium/cobalt efflux protein [Comamonas serinivorans]|uniref:Magnesium and cobalt efflux protein CorC n=1 Tax=Comamonas serinivorans TaxID=1082851 RepID=A0A1Y0EJB2_9BURK|nr:CBS domain-containing protein [Comamonas serinivorans]ARU03677.1 magnesium/cobalt efflux protein [Comamonas serinivorans]